MQGGVAGIDHRRLLQGRYEAEYLPRDFSVERAVPDFAFNILNREGLLYRPVVDEHRLERGGRRPSWPEGKSFAVCLTHDIDRVEERTFRYARRERLLQWRTAADLKQRFKSAANLGLDSLVCALDRGRPDPLWSFELWTGEEERCAARSTLFFCPGRRAVRRRHHTDAVYELGDEIVFDRQRCTVAEMLRELDRRGWEIGLHPAWYACDDTGELKRQKEALEEALMREVLSCRHHYLHYDIRVTPATQAASGLRYDSTLGFNDNVGFRFGTSCPWRLYDLHAEAELDLLEIPLIVHDMAMLNPFKGLRLDEETAFEYTVLLTERVKAVGGVLTLLWHPDILLDARHLGLYRKVLGHLRQEDAWFATIREVGEHWRKMDLD